MDVFHNGPSAIRCLVSFSCTILYCFQFSSYVMPLYCLIWDPGWLWPSLSPNCGIVYVFPMYILGGYFAFLYITPTPPPPPPLPFVDGFYICLVRYFLTFAFAIVFVKIHVVLLSFAGSVSVFS